MTILRGADRHFYIYYRMNVSSTLGLNINFISFLHCSYLVMGGCVWIYDKQTNGTKGGVFFFSSKNLDTSLCWNFFPQNLFLHWHRSGNFSVSARVVSPPQGGHSFRLGVEVDALKWKINKNVIIAILSSITNASVIFCITFVRSNYRQTRLQAGIVSK